jgi:hypothetical protein
MALEGAEVPSIEYARQLCRAGQYEDALFSLARLLEMSPFHPEATMLAAKCRMDLERECLSAVGSASAILMPAVTPEQLKQFTLDNISGFLVAQLDGVTEVETVLDISGLPRLLALRHLRNLVERGIVGVTSNLRSGADQSRDAVHDRRNEPAADDDALSLEAGLLSTGIGTLSLDAIPVLLVEREELDRLDLDPRARMLVGLVNDRMTIEDILVATRTDIAGGTALFEWLAEDGVVAFV